MDSTPSTPERGRLRRLLRGQRSLCARVVISWTMGGGVTAGGLLMAAVTMQRPETAQAVLPATAVLFALGAAAGLAHGSLLAYLGRPPAVERRSALDTILMALVSLVAGLPVAWVVAAWISLTSSILVGRAGPVWPAIVAWVGGLVICAWAVLEGSKALGNAFRRWPEGRTGAIVLSIALGVLVVVFHRFRPEIWFTHVRVTGAGAIALAFVATVWIAAPVVIVALHFLHRGHGGGTAAA